MISTDAPRLRCVRAPGGSPRQNVSRESLRENIGGGTPVATTTVRTTWDDLGWNLDFKCEDSNAWATITERDGPLWNEEVVEVFVDPVGDLQSYFEIEVNPINAVCDLVLRRSPSGWRKEFGWHCDGLTTSVARTPPGWTAALRIPFAAVTNDPVRVGTIWRVNFFRIDRPAGPGGTAELSAWSPTFEPTFHRAERFGVMEFCEG